MVKWLQAVPVSRNFLAGVVKTLARELGPAGIRVNGVLPVRIATDRVRELDALRGDPDEVRARLSEHIPLRRWARGGCRAGRRLRGNVWRNCVGHLRGFA